MSIDVDGSVDGAAAEATTTDEPGWEVDPAEDAVAVVVAVGRQIKMWREAAGLTADELGAAMGYSGYLIYKVESGKRIPRPEFLDKADPVLGADGKIAAMKKDVAEARYPRKVRELAKWESDAVEIGLYSNAHLHGLLQTKDYAKALLETRRPAYSPQELERMLAARMGRQSIYERSPVPDLSFVQEEVTLQRPMGGRMVLRQQLERLLELGQLPNVDIQVMPTEHAHHPGTGGLIELLKFDDGTAIGRCDGEFGGRPVSDPKQLRILELRYGIIRAQALTPQESLSFIEKILEGT